MGKWDALKDKFPALPADAGRMDLLKAHLDAWRDKTTAELVDLYEARRSEQEELQDLAKAKGLEAEAAETLLLEKIAAVGMDRITRNGRNYTPVTEPWPVIQDKAALLAYGTNGHPEVLTYAHGTVKSLMKAFLEGEGEKLPGVDVYMKHSLSRTKAK